MARPLPRYASPAVTLGAGYAVTFAFDGGAMAVEWTPGLPEPEIGRTLLPAYVAARNRFLTNLSAATGIVIAVVDAG